jgi:hypothetical protein
MMAPFYTLEAGSLKVETNVGTPFAQGLRCVNVEAESLPHVSLKYNITAVPTVVIFNQQKEVDRVNGANPAELLQKLKQQASNSLVP